ncbi:hypothetical protein CEXT_271351 [Caerostris extrusa]|uniref:Uncharacterized protein n=1 Tax=Caerostris extrusa TaxID=172846 RepID=A0AAV4U267_CAEEX|nr:hypothetical protein CEXT_271351 [Caerostris extrusa]
MVSYKSVLVVKTGHAVFAGLASYYVAEDNGFIKVGTISKNRTMIDRIRTLDGQLGERLGLQMSESR